MDRVNAGVLIGGIAVVGAAVGILVMPRGGPQAPTASPELLAATESFGKAKPGDTQALEKTIEEYKDSPAKDVQDQVTRARLTLGYAVAQKKDFTKARKIFLAAATEHKGTPTMHPDWGTVSDQALYQSIVCLQADGKGEQAKTEYRKFLQEHKLSPLAMACYRRLTALNGGKPDPNDEKLIAQSSTAQDARVKKELVICGPKCLKELLPMLGKPAPELAQLEKSCGTTAEGTSMEGMMNGLTAAGVRAKARALNRPDFADMHLPAIWLDETHFVLIKSIHGNTAQVYDPMSNGDIARALPPISDVKFRATVLELAP